MICTDQRPVPCSSSSVASISNSSSPKAHGTNSTSTLSSNPICGSRLPSGFRTGRRPRERVEIQWQKNDELCTCIQALEQPARLFSGVVFDECPVIAWCSGEKLEFRRSPQHVDHCPRAQKSDRDMAERNRVACFCKRVYRTNGRVPIRGHRECQRDESMEERSNRLIDFSLLVLGCDRKSFPSSCYHRANSCFLLFIVVP